MVKNLLASLLFWAAFSLAYPAGFQFGYLENIQVADGIRQYSSQAFNRNPSDVLGYPGIVMAQVILRVGLLVLLALTFWLLARRKGANSFTVLAGFVACFLFIRFAFFSFALNWVGGLIKMPFARIADSFYYFTLTGCTFVLLSLLVGFGAIRLAGRRHTAKSPVGSPQSA
ncbi:MAG: hypothetical protein EOO15_18350 [Chitinophagaceae bacterium]|nr:MAG: hypothetical protein EOO15_18350 [Chitinophagaceae bacterium]